MRIPDFFKTVQCDVCGHHCIPMSNGDRFYDVRQGKRVSVTVCFDCDSQLGDLAYLRASRKVEEEPPGRQITCRPF